MANNTIIVIGRQFGSGGHEVGKRLADRLDIPFYDRNLIQMAAEELGVSHEKAEEVDETILGKFLSAYVVGSGDYTMHTEGEHGEKPLSDKLFMAQSDIIRRLARRGSCIIVGRCADYILENEFQCINAFIYAEIEDRIRRIMRIYNLTEEEAWTKIKEVDNARKLYYEAHTGSTWGSIESHQMLFNVSLLNISDVVDILAAMYRARR
ncbi:cytidylate kinase-like family protein [Bariatricus massiliensis]|uniref:Cytidylate kinase-like family protein n=1 Tax=Bariatricus massiliensis TaxID=1745713 RepID=A0ABS8DDM0_9FIRM|nr:cytidylate kinase-like family protein [Bariatricus massiliensis]MCB7302597.1 cytidylate kinase-like family protein [Bariatricus massiliensis]MCB7373813.1 cytidylate kinase-like family protein [Bariatricus massiliensis]MCB7386483.1 cytidylate kinase-like family protein [Bariatricus massiliensis]MCB7410645.1 cytidylate kinase-like family protein [Bariatricus massiliensis]MCQ5253517.1 cytidylate kinase-like family protein [Bariatricus massiliensis]